MVTDLWAARDRSGHSARTVLDVGGGPGYFASAFDAAGWALYRRRTGSRDARRRGAPWVARQLRAGPPVWRCLSPTARSTPVLQRRRACRPAVAARREMLRATAGRAGDPLVHRVAGAVRRARRPACALPRRRAAAARYTRRHGHPPKNNYGSSLFAVSVADGLRWRSTVTLVAASALPPAMGLAGDLGTGRAGGAGQQPRAGVGALRDAELEPVLASRVWVV